MYAFLPSLSSENLTAYFFKFEYKFNKSKPNYGNFENSFFNIMYSAFQKLFVEQICSTYIDLSPINVSDD